jgi:hypothetical protein
MAGAAVRLGICAHVKSNTILFAPRIERSPSAPADERVDAAKVAG